MKKWLAALLALLLVYSCALAQDRPIALYELPEGAEVRFLSEAGDLVIPEGMETLYAMMNNAAWVGNVYLIRMPNGYGIASVSCRETTRNLSAQELLELWPRIAAEIALEAEWVDASAECAKAETCFEKEMLHIETSITLKGGLQTDAEGFAFCRDGEMTEIWAVLPKADAFPADDPVRALIESDREAMDFFVNSLAFPDSLEDVMGGRPYEAENGSYRLLIPADAEVITVKTSQDDIARVRERFIELNPEGADRAFDAMMANMYQTGADFIFTEDMKGVMEIYAGDAGELKGAKPENLSRMAPIIEKSLKERYDLAVCMEPDAKTVVNDREHALMGYWLRQGEMDLQLDLMVCVHEAGWMYEVDVFAAEGDQDVRALLHAYVMQTMQYTPPENALE